MSARKAPQGLLSRIKILNEDDQSREKDRTAFVIQDLYTYWLQAYAAPTKSAKDTIKAFQLFAGVGGEIEHVYTDNSKEFKFAFETLEIPHDTSTPHRSCTNGIAERAVRQVKEGTACTLVQSGFSEEWWVQAMILFCFQRNTVDQLLGGNTA